MEYETAERKASKVGFNAGAALAIALQPQLDLVLQVRYVYSPSMEVPGLDPTTQAEDLEELLPYDFSAERSRNQLDVEGGGLLPGITLRYTF